jgi:pantoate--beta-alanine ligase
VSIFVNPTQFAPTEDFSRYPRTFESDCALLSDVDCDLVFAPSAQEMYPEGFATTVMPGGPALAGLEDMFRPTHFAGVATIVCKLFTQCRPDVAIFGEKDYQQLQVVKRMALDLDLAVTVTGAPTICEADGLAMSSRNRYLSEDNRSLAVLVPDSLKAAIAAIRAGADPQTAAEQAKARLSEAGYTVDYVAVRHAQTLAPVTGISDGPLRILVAATIGKTRLIDNMAV